MTEETEKADQETLSCDETVRELKDALKECESFGSTPEQREWIQRMRVGN